MKSVVRTGDRSIGADGCCPITARHSSCYNVKAEGKNPMLVGNVFGRHPCGGKHCRHTAHVIMGSHKVKINGRRVLLTGLPLSCGDVAGIGTYSVFFS